MADPESIFSPRAPGRRIQHRGHTSVNTGGRVDCYNPRESRPFEVFHLVEVQGTKAVLVTPLPG